MLNVDKFLARCIVLTVCFLAVALVLTASIQSLKGYETDGNIKELAYLIVGGLLSRVTTTTNKEEEPGTQQVSVPAPLKVEEPEQLDGEGDAPEPRVAESRRGRAVRRAKEETPPEGDALR